MSTNTVSVQPTISKSPGAAQLASLLEDQINSMPQGLNRFQSIQRLRSQGYGVTYSKVVS
jgi:hypothetical protein